MRRLVYLWWRFPLILALLAGGTGCSRNSAQSRNWKLTVGERKLHSNSSGDQDFTLIVECQIQFLGPTGKVVLPAIHLQHPSGTIIQSHQAKFTGPMSERVLHAMLSDTAKFPMRTGELLCPKPFRLWFELPDRSGPVKLQVGDVPPIALDLPSVSRAEE
jgi:hypothetical protein